MFLPIELIVQYDGKDERVATSDEWKGYICVYIYTYMTMQLQLDQDECEDVGGSTK